MLHIYYFSDYFKKFNIEWDKHNLSQYYCETHRKVLPIDSLVLLSYIEKYHKVEETSSSNSNESFLVLPPLESILKVFKIKIWIVDFPNQNKSLNEYFSTYEVVSRPIRAVEDNPISSFLFDLRNDVFSNDDLVRITKVASWLEHKGNNVEWAKSKMGTPMLAFGM